MSVWLVRAGKSSQYEQFALKNDLAVVGWRRVPDLSGVANREALEEVFREVYPDVRPTQIRSHVAQLWKFSTQIEKGDLVVLPLRSRSAVAIGRVKGPYEYRTDLRSNLRHTRRVEWLKKDLPRTVFDQDILYSFGSMLTVCQIRRNNAEQRIRSLVEGKVDVTSSLDLQDEPGLDSVDIEQTARDQLLRYIGQTLKGHEMATLVGAVLKAQGYLIKLSPPGPDGGVDILAGSGPMGFDSPRLCVQVKSSDTPVGVKVFRELRGTMQQFNADQGLLVSWGGFNSKVISEAASSFFTVRLWDSGDLVDAVLQNYDRFPDQLQAELPLKKVWMLVAEE